MIICILETKLILTKDTELNSRKSMHDCQEASLFFGQRYYQYISLLIKKKKGNNTLHPDFEILHKFECIIIYLAFREKSLADLKQILTPSEKA